MATRFTASPSSISFKSASDAAVQLTIKDESGNDVTRSRTLGYSSDNEAVATVSSSGLVTAKGHGSCSVKAAATDKPALVVSVSVSVAG